MFASVIGNFGAVFLAWQPLTVMVGDDELWAAIVQYPWTRPTATPGYGGTFRSPYESTSTYYKHCSGITQ